MQLNNQSTSRKYLSRCRALVRLFIMRHQFYSTKRIKTCNVTTFVGIYKPDPVREYDEYTKVEEGFDYISKLAVEWENSSKLTDECPTRRVIIRSGTYMLLLKIPYPFIIIYQLPKSFTGVVLGRTGGMINQVFLPFYFGLGGPIGSGGQYFPWIHVHDICRLMLFSIKNEKVNGVLNGVAPQVKHRRSFTSTNIQSYLINHYYCR